MTWTIILNFVRKELNWCTIMTFLIRLVCPFALCFHFADIVLKTFMLSIFGHVLNLSAVGAFLIRSMLTLMLNQRRSLFRQP